MLVRFPNVSYGPEERRRHPRFSAGACAWLEFAGEDTLGTVSVDMSLEGAQFAGIREVQPGQRVLACLQTRPGAQPIECKARVCWSRHMADGLCHFGVRFMDLNHDDHENVEAFLAERSSVAALMAV